jgi:hypothetical protein
MLERGETLGKPSWCLLTADMLDIGMRACMRQD